MNIAIVGSREYPYLEDVEKLVRIIHADDMELNRPSTIVSGGAKGVDETAEQEAIRLGMTVLSYRVCQVELDGYGVEEWKLGAQPHVRVMQELPYWDTYDSALNYRNSIIIAKAERVVAFWSNWSRGTSLAIDFAHAYKRPLRTYGLGEFERLQTA